MLSIQNVSKSYSKGRTRAVDQLSLEARPGEIFGFLGPNGAGKTTTLKMIAGILPVDEGRILVNGHDIMHDPLQAKRCMGYVPDNHEVYERLTGFEYLNFLADVFEVSVADRKAAIGKYLAMFDLEQAAGQPIKSYSHGMKQKIVLTGALLHNPSLWLLDEPLTGLDPKAAHLLKEEMGAHCAKGNAVFFSTHVLEVAERLCHRIGIIHHGKLVAVGTMDELRQSGDDSLEEIFLELTEETEAAHA